MRGDHYPSRDWHPHAYSGPPAQPVSCQVSCGEASSLQPYACLPSPCLVTLSGLGASFEWYRLGMAPANEFRVDAIHCRLETGAAEDSTTSPTWQL